LTTVRCYPQNGVLRFEHFFAGEMPWKICIRRAETEKHFSDFTRAYMPWCVRDGVVEFCVYSLYGDLYEKRPFKGDLHIHTCRTDGFESPAFVACQYRKFGYDFIAVTDHYVYEPSIEAMDWVTATKSALKLFPGEEVHHPDVGDCYSFHFVNFNGKYSVNDLIRKDPEGVLQEVCAISKDIDCADEDKLQVAWYKWVYQEIKKAEGIAIYPHPLWILLGAYNIKTSVSESIYKNGYCDVVEIFGGGGNKTNHKLQPMLYYDGKEKGYNYPIVASNDAHSALQHNSYGFDHAFSIVFAENADKIPENILQGNTVAIDNWNTEEKTAYAPFRFARYAHFLLEEYYPMHDEYCFSTGQAMLRLLYGDETQNDLVGILEEELRKYNSRFFGE
jgi:predicted metal-dependent phosphoesterase TrpH